MGSKESRLLALFFMMEPIVHELSLGQTCQHGIVYGA